ncbi:HAMP domain-containing sensor histidine kinase [uncultured Ferrimonas sp.]|uniref:sensor histidine kinase n=1 Tax=uncultured Ferrimonas sp. TaxID=432640 RepID=UPI0026083EB7|nr:HAMP domain-containing sensor histidine kinase [uncultured Ferrimonas sp.]
MTNSLRRYLIGAVLLLAVVVSTTLSLVTLSYFIGGIHTEQSLTLLNVARYAEANDLDDATVLNAHVTRDWHKVPQAVRQLITAAPQQSYRLYKGMSNDFPHADQSQLAFVLRVEGQDGISRYVSTLIQPEFYDSPEEQQLFVLGEYPVLTVVAIACACVLLFVLVLWGITWQITKPAQRLTRWAQALGPESATEPLPDFKYRELNELAQIIHGSFEQVQHSVEREREFLRYASHELRTPITVIRANSAVLAKLTEATNAKQSRVQQRIERAGKTMAELVETLLWMSREQQLQVAENVKLGALVQELVTELDYLRQKQQIELRLDVDDSLWQVAKTPCRIVISNLIRNAFEHSSKGNVSIIQQQQRLQICNPISDGESNDVGFGLGLKLSRKLAAQYGWQLNEYRDVGLHRVEVRFK